MCVGLSIVVYSCLSPVGFSTRQLASVSHYPLCVISHFTQFRSTKKAYHCLLTGMKAVFGLCPGKYTRIDWGSYNSQRSEWKEPQLSLPLVMYAVSQLER